MHASLFRFTYWFLLLTPHARSPQTHTVMQFHYRQGSRAAGTGWFPCAAGEWLADSFDERVFQSIITLYQPAVIANATRSLCDHGRASQQR